MVESTTFTGRTTDLFEWPNRPEIFEEFDDIPADRINYEDLVFTLKHDPTKYSRPKVFGRHGALFVVGNNTFYRAALEAGLDQITFDLLEADSSIARLAKKHDLYIPQSLPMDDVLTTRFVFFQGSTANKNLVVPQVQILSATNAPDFVNHHCVVYSVPNVKAEERKSAEESFFITSKRLYGDVRSIDGLIPTGSLSPSR